MRFRVILRRFRKVRLFFFGGFGLGATIGGFTALTQLAATLSGQEGAEPLTKAVTNIAVDWGVVAACLFGFNTESKAEQQGNEQMSQKNANAAAKLSDDEVSQRSGVLAALPIEISLGGGGGNSGSDEEEEDDGDMLSAFERAKADAAAAAAAGPDDENDGAFPVVVATAKPPPQLAAAAATAASARRVTVGEMQAGARQKIVVVAGDAEMVRASLISAFVDRKLIRQVGERRESRRNQKRESNIKSPGARPTCSSSPFASTAVAAAIAQWRQQSGRATSRRRRKTPRALGWST